MFWTPALGVHTVLEDIATAYTASNSIYGSLGWPIADRYPTTGGGFTQPFQHGRIHWSPATGAHVVAGVVSAKYDTMRGEAGVLGYPVTDLYQAPSAGFTQAFQGGRIHWSPLVGAQAVYWEISDTYDRLGGPSGTLGYPVADRYSTPQGGWTQPFQYGRIHYSPATGAHAVVWPLSPVYDSMRGESGVLGYPWGEQYSTSNGGLTQAFQGGRIHWSPTTGAFAVYWEISQAYDGVGGEGGVLGYPVGARYPTRGNGWTQPFQYGRIHYSPATGAHAVVGAVSAAYDARGGEAGVLGYPVGDQRTIGPGQVEQLFERGRIRAFAGITSVTLS
jgi:uncharacterized protein with LGFP repeats